MAGTAEKNSGFILLHRSLREHWLWKDPVKFQWWVDILMECNHEDKKVCIKFELLDCKRGQSLNSYLTWSKRWRVGVSTVRRFLYLCESDLMVTIEDVKKTTRLTVCNYDYYNDYRQLKQSQEAGKRQATQSQEAGDAIQTKNELKNELKKGGASAPITHSEEKLSEFKKFEGWITDNAPRVAQMKEPFTIEQFIKIKGRYPVTKITDILTSMHNYEPLLKKSRSAYLTALKWLKIDADRNPGKGSAPQSPTLKIPT